MQVLESNCVAATSETFFPVNADNEILPGKSVAAEEGALVVCEFRAGVQSVIGACVRTCEAVTRFRSDPSAIDEFLSPLVEGNIISPSEARLGLASPKLSKFGAIGQNAEVLCHERVFQYLPPGYTLSREDKVALLLSAGRDSITTGIACQAAGKAVHAYTYVLTGKVCPHRNCK